MLKAISRCFRSTPNQLVETTALATSQKPSSPAQAKMSSTPQADNLEYASSCYLPTSFIKLKLLAVNQYNHDCKIFDFQLPEGQSLNLPVCACILVRGGSDADGNPVVRPYTPISSNAMLGRFQLLIKRYETGTLSKFMCDDLKVGDDLEFMHIKFNIKIQHPFGKRFVGMICGGSGITPAYQALQRISDTADDNTEVTVLFGNKTQEDMILQKEMDKFAEESDGRIKIVHVLSNDESYEGEKGFINAELVEKYFPAPGDDNIVFVCGPPPMYNALCGPRDEKDVAEGTVLHKLGYNGDQVFKF